jgi:hypothetical protein
VDVVSPRTGHGKLTARTRKGYYAPAVAGSASAGGN